MVQKFTVAVFQKVLLARPVDILHRLVELGGRGIQLHAVRAGPGQAHRASSGLRHVPLIVRHHLLAQIVHGQAVDKADLGQLVHLKVVRHG